MLVLVQVGGRCNQMGDHRDTAQQRRERSANGEVVQWKRRDCTWISAQVESLSRRSRLSLSRRDSCRSSDFKGGGRCGDVRRWTCGIVSPLREK